jgi:DUF1680 family protein
VYKWLEGASYTLALSPDAALEAKVDEVIALISAAQQKDGYLDTYIQLVNPQARWANLAFFHEDFNAGHFFEAAVAHYESTGKKTLLDVAIRNADLWDSVFGPGKRAGIPGHEGVELALVRLYRATGEKRYLRLAQFFIDGRGQKPSFFEGEYQRLNPAKTANFLGEVRTIRYWQDRCFAKIRISSTRATVRTTFQRDNKRTSLVTPCAPCICSPEWPMLPTRLATRDC